MYYKLNNDEFERIKEVEKITLGDYELLGNFIPVESMMNIIEDLLVELGKSEEKYKDFEQQVEDNYKPISYEEQVGFTEKDFF